MRLVAALATVVVSLPLSAAQASPEVTALGPSREISRSASASRDTPTLNLLLEPRDVRTAGAELSLATVRFGGWTLRTGFAGMIELEFDAESDGTPFGGSGRILWRGSYAAYAAASLDRLAVRLCRGCSLELSAGLRHESQHYTGSNSGGDGIDVSDQPFVGDNAVIDGAWARRDDKTFASARVELRGYIPGRSSYSLASAVDLHARWTGLGRFQPFVSGWAEWTKGREEFGRRYPDAYLLRALAGVAVNSRLGDILVYGFGDVGHRKGVRILTEEATLGLGVRLALP